MALLSFRPCDSGLGALLLYVYHGCLELGHLGQQRFNPPLVIHCAIHRLPMHLIHHRGGVGQFGA